MFSTRTLTARVFAMLFVPIVLAACAGGDSTEESSEDSVQADPAAASTDTSSSSTATTSAATGASDAADQPLTPADIQGYERGLRAEIDRINEVIAEKGRAKTATDTLSAMMAATAQQTVEIGARAAGLPVERYRDVAEVVDGVLGARQMQALMEKTKADTINLPADARARAREATSQPTGVENDPYKNLPGDVVDVLKQRAVGLDSLRMQLVGLRFKAAQ